MSARTDRIRAELQRRAREKRRAEARGRREEAERLLDQPQYETLTPIEREARLDQYQSQVEEIYANYRGWERAKKLAELTNPAVHPTGSPELLETVSPDPPVMPTPMSQRREQRRSLRDVLRRRLRQGGGRASTILTQGGALGGGSRLA